MQQEENLMVLPAIPLRGVCVLPGMITNIDLNRPSSLKALEAAMRSQKKLFLVTQRMIETEENSVETLYEVGCVAKVLQIVNLPNQIVRVVVEGMERAHMDALQKQKDGMSFAQVSLICMQECEWEEIETEARARILKELLARYLFLQPTVPKELAIVASNTMDFHKLLTAFAAYLPFYFQVRQTYLEISAEEILYETILKDLRSEIDILQLKKELQEEVKSRMEKHQREYMLREQIHVIKKELGEDESIPDAEAFVKQLDELQATETVKEKIRKEISRLRNVSGSSSESAMQRVYVETLLEMPWERAGKDSADLDVAQEILEKNHYGLNQVKTRIMEYLAVRMLAKESESTIICLVGPPGTGKTSIAKSVAEAMNKEYVRICLGGIRDEAEIRGHRRTYIGAMPGRIVNAIKQAGVNNPLILLDEIDKIAKDYKGDPASALLEVLDSQQNKAFRDHYIEIPIDLSTVCFIATANNLADIPRPLLDRMEVIEVNSYTANEKFHIAKDHLWKKQLAKNGIAASQLSLSDTALKSIIRDYTKEAGVRELERKIAALCRKTARAIVQEKQKSIKINDKNLEKYLGKAKYRSCSRDNKAVVGLANGLAWTSVGGDVLAVEVLILPGKGKVHLTGQMGDVMKESARIGFSYVRSVGKKYQVDENFYHENDFHIHIPEGAVPKDGPSAGITMATAMLSALAQIPVKADVAMTGEITLRGRVLPVGGLKEKILAAKIAGMKEVLIPSENERNIQELEEEVRSGLEIIYVDKMESVLERALQEVNKKGTLR